MYFLSFLSHDLERPHPFAALTPLESKPVSDMVLAVLAPKADTLYAVLKSYPRQSEPAAAPFARALSLIHSAMEFLPDVPECRFQVHEGDSVSNAELIETIDIAVKGDVIKVVWEDGSSRRSIEARARPGYPGPGQVLEHALRLAAWGFDDVPALPVLPARVQGVALRQAARTGQVVQLPSLAAMPASSPGSAQTSAPTSSPPGCQARETAPGTFYAPDWVDFLTK